jgi:hypothetical protein
MITMTSQNISVFYDFMEDPERAAQQIRQDPPVLLGFFAFLVSSFSTFLAEALTGRLGFLGASMLSMSIAILWHLGIGLLQAAVVHVVAEASGGEGKVVPLFVLLGLSELAWALVLPGVLVVQAFFPDSPWAIAGLFFAVSLIVMYLKVRSIVLNYGFGVLQALFALIFPLLAAAASLFMICAVAMGGLFQQLLKLSS